MKLNCCKVRRRFLLSSANWLIKRRLLSPSSSLESDEQILSIGADFFWGFLDISFCDFNFLFRFQNMFSESEIMIEGMVVSSKFVKLTCFKLPWWYFCLIISRNSSTTSRFWAIENFSFLKIYAWNLKSDIRKSLI